VPSSVAMIEVRTIASVARLHWSDELLQHGAPKLRLPRDARRATGPNCEAQVPGAP
jgi:hypothetical protein